MKLSTLVLAKIHRWLNKDESSEECNISSTSNILKNLKSLLLENNKGFENELEVSKETPKLTGGLGKKIEAWAHTVDKNSKRISDYFEDASAIDAKSSKKHSPEAGPSIQIHSFKDRQMITEDVFKKQKAPKTSSKDPEFFFEIQHSHFVTQPLMEYLDKGLATPTQQMRPAVNKLTKQLTNPLKSKRKKLNRESESDSIHSFFRLFESLKMTPEYSKTSSYPTFFFEDTHQLSQINTNMTPIHKKEIANLNENALNLQLQITNSTRKNIASNRHIFATSEQSDPKTQFKSPLKTTEKAKNSYNQCSLNEVTLKAHSGMQISRDQRRDENYSKKKLGSQPDSFCINIDEIPNLVKKANLGVSVKNNSRPGINMKELRTSSRQRNDSETTRMQKDPTIYKIKSSSTFRKNVYSPSSYSQKKIDLPHANMQKQKVDHRKDKSSNKVSRKNSSLGENMKLSLLKMGSVTEKDRGKFQGSQTERPDIQNNHKESNMCQRVSAMCSNEQNPKNNLHKKTLSQHLVLNSKIFRNLRKNFRGSINLAKLEGNKLLQTSDLNQLDVPRAPSIEKQFGSTNPVNTRPSTQNKGLYCRQDYKSLKTITMPRNKLENASAQEFAEERKDMSKELLNSPMKKYLFKQLQTKLSLENRNGSQQKIVSGLKNSIQDDPGKHSKMFYNSISHEVDKSPMRYTMQPSKILDEQKKVSIGKIKRIFPKSEKVIEIERTNPMPTNKVNLKTKESIHQVNEPTSKQKTYTQRKGSDGVALARIHSNSSHFLHLNLPKPISVKKPSYLAGDSQGFSQRVLGNPKSGRNSRSKKIDSWREHEALALDDDDDEDHIILKKTPEGNFTKVQKSNKQDTINIRKELQLEKQRSMSKKLPGKLVSGSKKPKLINGAETERSKRTNGTTVIGDKIFGVSNKR